MDCIMKTARGRFIARRAFINPRVTLGDGDSEFYIVNSHIDKREIIVDTDTAQILGVIDLEFTNAQTTPSARLQRTRTTRLLPTDPEESRWLPTFKINSTRISNSFGRRRTKTYSNAEERDKRKVFFRSQGES